MTTSESQEARTGASRILRSSAGMASAAIGVIASLLSIVFLVRPSWQPEDKPDERPPVMAASLANPTLEQQVPLGSVYDRRGTPPDARLTATDLDTLGILVNYDVAITGYKGKQLILRWSAYHADKQTLVAEPWLVDQEGFPDAKFNAEADSDAATGQLWVASPAAPGDYFVRLELFDPKGVRVSALDTPVFTVTVQATATASASGAPPAPAPSG